MDLFDKILSNQGTEEDSEFMPLVSLDEGEESESLEPLPKTLPILALKNTVLFPGLLVPITISREKSIKALNKAHDSKKLLGVLTQKDVKDEEPGFDDLYKVGTVAKIVKILRMPDGTTTAILQGKKRFSIENMITEDPHLEATVKYLDYKVVKNKMAPPFKFTEFDIVYGEGVSKLGEIIDYATELDILGKSGSWYSFEGQKVGQGRENVKKFLRDNPELTEELERRIKALVFSGKAELNNVEAGTSDNDDSDDDLDS